MQSHFIAARMGNRSSVDPVISAVRWAFPVLAMAVVAANLVSMSTSAFISSANARPPVVVDEAYLDLPHLIAHAPGPL